MYMWPWVCVCYVCMCVCFCASSVIGVELRADAQRGIGNPQVTTCQSGFTGMATELSGGYIKQRGSYPHGITLTEVCEHHDLLPQVWFWPMYCTVCPYESCVRKYPTSPQLAFQTARSMPLIMPYIKPFHALCILFSSTLLQRTWSVFRRNCCITLTTAFVPEQP